MSATNFPNLSYAFHHPRFPGPPGQREPWTKSTKKYHTNNTKNGTYGKQITTILSTLIHRMLTHTYTLDLYLTGPLYITTVGWVGFPNVSQQTPSNNDKETLYCTQADNSLKQQLQTHSSYDITMCKNPLFQTKQIQSAKRFRWNCLWIFVQPKACQTL